LKEDPLGSHFYGYSVGVRVRSADGTGPSDGAILGLAVGFLVGRLAGELVGAMEGAAVGLSVGDFIGFLVVEPSSVTSSDFESVPLSEIHFMAATVVAAKGTTGINKNATTNGDTPRSSTPTENTTDNDFDVYRVLKYNT
jgi:hypothetical protein